MTIFNAMVNTPAPVIQHPSVALKIVYLIVRGDGQIKLCEHLHTRTGQSSWHFPQHPPAPDAIVVPVDIHTALRLNMVDSWELQLTEGQKALLNTIS